MDVAAAFAGIATSLAQTFGVGFHAGVAKWSGEPVMAGGSIVTPGTPAQIACQVQVDDVTEAMRTSGEYRDQDMRLLVLSSGLARDIDTDATIEVTEGPHAGAWKSVSVSRDPAGIYFQCLGRKA